MATTIIKSLVGIEDVAKWDGTSTKTYTRKSVAGGTLTMNKVMWPGVDVYATQGTADDTAISTAIAACGSDSVRVWLSPRTWAISDDLTIPSNILLAVPPGALLQVAAGKILTIQGPIDAGAYQIFSGSGTVSITRVGAQYAGWESGGADQWQFDSAEITTLTSTTITGVAWDGESNILANQVFG